MRIEFQTVGDGTNIQVSLLEDLSGSEVTKDRFYTLQRRFPFCMVPGSPQCDYEQTFYDLESVLSPPVISGRWGAHHPYWAERLEKRQRRARKQALNGS